jgi:hypothetical protein
MHIPIALNDNPAQCAALLKNDSEDVPELVLFFASSKLDNETAALALHKNFPQSEVIGCSTAGEILSGSMTEGSIVAMAIPTEYVDRAVTEYIRNPGNPEEVAEATIAIEAAIGQPLRDLDPSSYVGLVLVDGLSGAEEKLMDKLGDLTDFPFIGGAAGDDLAFCKTWVGLNGISHDHGAVIAILHAPKGYRIIKTQSFRSTGKCLRATSVDEASRRVIEFDGQPAAHAYASALGVPVQKLPEMFMMHPLGLMIAGEPFVRSPQRICGTSVVFYCNMREGTELEILESRDIVADTGAILAPAVGTAAALINFHCILRTLELKAKNQCDEYGRLFAGVPTIGFSTYGEEYMGHMNQTSTMLLFPAA